MTITKKQPVTKTEARVRSKTLSLITDKLMDGNFKAADDILKKEAHRRISNRFSVYETKETL